MASNVVSPDWTPAPGASAEQIKRLVTSVPHLLPAEYINLLANTNGGEGALAVRPGWFQLFAVEFALELWNDESHRREYPDLLFFGSNGGLESFAIAVQGPRAGEVLALDAIAGEESAFLVARSFAEFTKHMGKQAQGEA
jgi:hypothetical protein